MKKVISSRGGASNEDEKVVLGEEQDTLTSMANWRRRFGIKGDGRTHPPFPEIRHWAYTFMIGRSYLIIMSPLMQSLARNMIAYTRSRSSVQDNLFASKQFSKILEGLTQPILKLRIWGGVYLGGLRNGETVFSRHIAET